MPVRTAMKDFFHPPTRSSEPARHRPARWIVFFLLIAIPSVCLWTNQRTGSAWKRYRAELAIRGESLDWKDYLPSSMPPDEENFGATPVLQAIGCRGKVNALIWERFTGVGVYGELGSIGDWTRGQRTDLESVQAALGRAGLLRQDQPGTPGTDVLAALDALRPEFDELREASKRPQARLKLNHPDPASADTPNFVALRTLTQMFSLCAGAELSLNKTNEAFADIRVIQRLADLTRQEPSLVAVMMYCAIHQMALQAFWEGWVSGQWSDAQLEKFQREFAAVNMLAAFDWGMRGERAGVNTLLETLDGPQLSQIWQNTVPGDNGWKHKIGTAVVRFSPPGLRSENLLNYDRLLDATCFIAYDLRQLQIFPSKCDAGLLLMEKSFSRSTAQNHLAAIALPNFTRALQTVARNQTFVNLARIVCGLERYRRANGEYPVALEQLLPRHLDQLPLDLISGGKLKYRQSAEGRFTLYSIGWNEKDDGGDPDKNDWVWPVKAIL